MLVIRIIALLAAVALGATALLYALTGEKRYLRWSWNVFKYGVFLLALVLLLIFFERLLVMV